MAIAFFVPNKIATVCLKKVREHCDSEVIDLPSIFSEITVPDSR